MFNIKDIYSWRKEFGLFPISIKPTRTEKYALFDGGQRDFCIDLSPNDDFMLYNSYAWSANIKNYLAVSDSQVTIYNWLKSTPESIEINKVQNNIEKFYLYLGKQTYYTNNDVVPFILNLFRKMRNLTREEATPQYALNLLYILLISLEEDLNQLDYKKWAIDTINLPSQFDYFVKELKSGIGDAKPDLEIILRHCSGPIFQEAHRVVQTFYSERDLFGDVSSKIITSIQEYSSLHYTPQYVARSVVEQCLKRLNLQLDSITIFDPACGSAEFLMEILKQLQNKQYKGHINIKCWDSSESAISTSKFLLNYEKETIWHEQLSLDICVVHDSLECDWGANVDVILMNPPFVSWELLNKSQRETVSDSLMNEVSKPNQAVAFFKKAMDTLSVDGVLGCVMPTTFFISDSYKCIRNQMKSELFSCFVAKLGNFVFDNALTDVSIYVGQKPIHFSETQLLWCRNESGVAQEALCALRKTEANGFINCEKDKYSIYFPIKYPDSQDSWKIISWKDTNLKEKLNDNLMNGMLVKLQTIFTVRQGVRSGGNNIFIIDVDEYERMSENERKYYRKSVDNEAINYSILKAKHYIWYPYDSTGLMIKSVEELQTKAPISYERLSKHINKLEKRKSLSNSSYWWSLSRHRDWLIKKNLRLVSTEFGNSKSFSIDLVGDYIVERGYAWIPKKKFDSSDYYFYLAFFSSDFFEKELSIYARQLAGGAWYDFSAKYTNQIPIPDVNRYGFRNSQFYLNLVEFGKVILIDGSSFYSYRINEHIQISLGLSYDNRL